MAWKTKIDKADKIFSQWVRIRDGKCLRCLSPVRFNEKGLPVSHEASHFMGRRKEATRFDPDNVMTLCSGCHSYLGSQPAEHYQFQVNRLGQNRVDILVLNSNTYQKKDRQAEYLYWRQKLKDDFKLDF